MARITEPYGRVEKPTYKLIATAGELKGQKILLDREKSTVGAAKWAHVKLTTGAPQIAVIKQNENGWLIDPIILKAPEKVPDELKPPKVELNGTHIYGPTQLTLGDSIIMGQNKFQIGSDEPESDFILSYIHGLEQDYAHQKIVFKSRKLKEEFARHGIHNIRLLATHLRELGATQKEIEKALAVAYHANPKKLEDEGGYKEYLTNLAKHIEKISKRTGVDSDGLIRLKDDLLSARSAELDVNDLAPPSFPFQEVNPFIRRRLTYVQDESGKLDENGNAPQREITYIHPSNRVLPYQPHLKNWIIPTKANPEYYVPLSEPIQAALAAYTAIQIAKIGMAIRPTRKTNLLTEVKRITPKLVDA